MGNVTSHHIAEATRLTYTQVVQFILAHFMHNIIYLYNNLVQGL